MTILKQINAVYPSQESILASNLSKTQQVVGSIKILQGYIYQDLAYAGSTKSDLRDIARLAGSSKSD